VTVESLIESTEKRKPLITTRSLGDIKDKDFQALVEQFLVKWRFYAYANLVSSAPMDMDMVCQLIEADLIEYTTPSL
jgi:hypothetical protein